MAAENQKEPSFGRFLFGLAIIGMIALVFIISPRVSGAHLYRRASGRAGNSW